MKIIPFISHNSEYSRRKAQSLIEAGKVFINGKRAIVTDEVGENSKVQVNGIHIKVSPVKKTFLVYKPKGYISTTSDEKSRNTVLDLIPKQDVRIYPVGRLDAESKGLMILTNDGELAQKYSHPKHETQKVYKVTLNRKMDEKILNKLIKGVKLKDGLAKPDEVIVVENNSTRCILEITLHEGKNREIRRMMGKLGFEVTDLERIKIGEYTLDNLKGRKFIQLSPLYKRSI